VTGFAGVGVRQRPNLPSQPSCWCRATNLDNVTKSGMVMRTYSRLLLGRCATLGGLLEVNYLGDRSLVIGSDTTGTNADDLVGRDSKVVRLLGPTILDKLK
jgi:hypothetical protein